MEATPFSKPQNYEEALKRVEEIVEKMNQGALSLEESVNLYEEADSLIKFAEEKLLKAEKRIETITLEKEKNS